LLVSISAKAGLHESLPCGAIGGPLSVATVSTGSVSLSKLTLSFLVSSWVFWLGEDVLGRPDLLEEREATRILGTWAYFSVRVKAGLRSFLAAAALCITN
jgi:multisubunit Na+/H+ antiporter MnhE subunit